MEETPQKCLVLLALLLCFLAPADSKAQGTPDTLQVTRNDTIPEEINREAVMDSIRQAQQQIPQQSADTLSFGQGTQQSPQDRQAERRSAEDAVNFQASDSLTFNFGNKQRIGLLYGSANVTHTNGQLDAGTIELDLQKNQVEAFTTTPEDTLSYPVLKQGNQDLRSTRVLFNYETEKGKFEVAEMEVDEGFLIGTKVKNVSEREVFIEDGIYSTCPPDHMYYYIQAKRMKLVDEEEIFFTNARLFILDIPYPLIFPFGYVPAGIEDKRSGLLEPTYVFENTSTRGIGLQNLGWFQYFSDFFVGQTSFDLFTSGTFFNESRFQYRKTGKYSGSITTGYSREQGLEPTDLSFTENKTRRLSVTHDQQISPYSNLNADVNLSTSDFFQRNSFDLDERAQTNSNSRISYRFNHPEGTYNLSASTRLNQQFNTNVASLSGPEVRFSLRQFSPFQNEQTTGQDEAWFERLSVSYDNNFKSEFNFNPIDRDSADINWFEALFSPSKFREATGEDRHLQFGFVQRMGINASQIIPSQFLNVGASINFTEFWYPTTSRREFNPELNRTEIFQERGFETAREFNTNLNFSTTFFGISQAKIGPFEGFRHTVRPNISFSYRPDFSTDFWGFYREVQVDTLGNTQRFSIFEREIFGGPGAGEQRTMSFGINNILETKVVRRDTTGEIKTTDLRLIDNASINSNYNFAADSLNFGRVNMSVSSRAVDGIRLRASAAYSVYARDENGREINRFIWNESKKPLQPLSYNLSASTSINGGSRGPQIQTPAYRPYDPYDQTFFSPVDQRFNLQPIQNHGTPWSFGLDFSYRWTFRFGRNARKSATLNATNIQFNLTPKWRFSTRIGYDFIEKDFTPSQFNLQRDMICWNLTFQFNPIGDFQYFFFRLSVNSSHIQGLFQKLPGLNNLERSSSPTGRRPGF